MHETEIQILSELESRLARHLSTMQQSERLAFMANVFGNVGIKELERLCERYPELMSQGRTAG